MTILMSQVMSQSIDYESTEEEIIESGSEFEQDNAEEPLSLNSDVEIKLD